NIINTISVSVLNSILVDNNKEKVEDINISLSKGYRYMEKLGEHYTYKLQDIRPVYRYINILNQEIQEKKEKNNNTRGLESFKVLIEFVLFLNNNITQEGDKYTTESIDSIRNKHFNSTLSDLEKLGCINVERYIKMTEEHLMRFLENNDPEFGKSTID
ncbi:hypothetical protein LR004_03025, partial [Candidatus Gracilibacteria bacterium]|nr:hypothetical protein [Candidatus Gracilibacteria bacterium]